MYITSSDIEMQSSRIYSNTIHQHQEVSLEWKNTFSDILNEKMRPGDSTVERSDILFLENTINSLFEKMFSFSIDIDSIELSNQPTDLSCREMDLVMKQLQFFDQLFDILFEQNFETDENSIFKYIHRYGSKTGENEARNSSQISRKIEWRMTTTNHHSYHEKENTTFDSKGTIKTKDGREINVRLSLDMAREFVFHEKRITEETGFANFIDPLVLNSDRAATGLSNSTFNFDLNSDGKAEEEIPFLLPGSGFLAFDMNHDGLINNGSELFGPTTGNGFDELSLFDDDGNQWIDEGDSIFDQLSLWTKDDQGNDFLTSLEDSGVGAIYLDNEDTLFDLKDQENNLLGQVRKTGIFLNEDGTVKTIQQVDFVA